MSTSMQIAFSGLSDVWPWDDLLKDCSFWYYSKHEWFLTCLFLSFFVFISLYFLLKTKKKLFPCLTAGFIWLIYFILMPLVLWIDLFNLRAFPAFESHNFCCGKAPWSMYILHLQYHPWHPLTPIKPFPVMSSRWHCPPSTVPHCILCVREIQHIHATQSHRDDNLLSRLMHWLCLWHFEIIKYGVAYWTK